MCLTQVEPDTTLSHELLYEIDYVDCLVYFDLVAISEDGQQ